MKLTRAEAELIDLLRGLDAEDFATTISRVGDAWTVRVCAPGLDTSVGHGTTFGQAWFAQRPAWSIQPAAIQACAKSAEAEVGRPAVKASIRLID